MSAVSAAQLLNDVNGKYKCRPAAAQAVSHRPVTAEARVRVWVISCGIYDWHCGTWAGFSPSFFLVLPCQNYSTVALRAHTSPGDER